MATRSSMSSIPDDTVALLANKNDAKHKLSVLENKDNSFIFS